MYIEIAGHRILFDMGPDSSFLKNAEKLGVDIGSVDLAIISHGHYDHGGGLGAFLKTNVEARVYAREGAFEKRYSKRAFFPVSIGLDRFLKKNKRIINSPELCMIDDGIFLFSGVMGRRFFSTANNNLLEKTKNGLICDSFAHEQNLLIQREGGDVLITGCSHNGIVNIIDRYKSIFGAERHLSHIIGGFHLYSAGNDRYESPEVVAALAEELNGIDAVFHTCHCTGPVAFEQMKSVMGDKLEYLRTGDRIQL